MNPNKNYDCIWLVNCYEECENCIRYQSETITDLDTAEIQWELVVKCMIESGIDTHLILKTEQKMRTLYKNKTGR